jgi:glyoxylase-like metal-dependent hydrolase (beta-lactamase superfamily II)
VTRLVEAAGRELPLSFFPNADPAQLSVLRSWFQPGWAIDDATLTLTVSGFLLVTPDGTRILVDTCVGNWEMPGMEAVHNEDSPFLRELATAGVQPEEIDIVTCTHMHFDHVGWNTQLLEGNIVPTFPNAHYLFADKEWANAVETIGSDPALGTFDRTVRPLVDAGQAELVPTDHEICAEVKFLESPGHTPGHVAVQIRSGDDNAVITGDLAHHPVQLAKPEWASAFDVDPEASTETRRRLIADWLRDDTLIIGTHFPAGGMGRLERAPDGIRYVPIG